MIAAWTLTRNRSQGNGIKAQRRGRHARGFTLIEAALATVIIGVGVLAMVEAQAFFLRSNEWSTGSATGTYLANELRERMRKLPKFDPVNGLVLTTGGSGTTLTGWGPRPGMTLADYNNLTCYDGKTFGTGGDAGPIDAVGRVISNIRPDGTIETDTNGNAVAMRGWRQTVLVEKVDPFNFGTVRAPSYTRAAQGSLPALAVDQFPVRVTVRVFYRGNLDAAEQEVAKVCWIVP